MIIWHIDYLNVAFDLKYLSAKVDQKYNPVHTDIFLYRVEFVNYPVVTRFHRRQRAMRRLAQHADDGASQWQI